MNWINRASLFLLLTVSTMSCQRPSATTPAPVEQSSPHDDPNRIHEILLPRYQPTLPPATGREVFAAACLSCHSSRYITMQPPLPANKWEDSVRKMMKVYAAPISEDQIPTIVQYIMATKEKGLTKGWDARTTAAWSNQGFSVPVLSDNPEQIRKDLALGKEIYDKGCNACHGPAGRGDGRTASEQLPRPTDLTTAAYTPHSLAASIVYGVPGTSMPAVQLSEDHARALVTYCLQFSRKPETVKLPDDQLKSARTLFIQYCATCHDETGDGNGPQSATQPRPPANFHLKQPSAEWAASAIANGVPGSTMPQWKSKLTADQQKLLVEYVRSKYSAQ